jgi:hypothetical protein
VTKKMRRFSEGGMNEDTEHTPDAEPIDYKKPDKNLVRNKYGHRLEYGVPTTEKGEFKYPDRDAFYDNKLDYDTFAEQKRAYAKWREDYKKRNPNAKFDPEGKVISTFGGINPKDYETKKKKGGMIGSASKRADGIAQRGKTRGKMV